MQEVVAAVYHPVQSRWEWAAAGTTHPSSVLVSEQQTSASKPTKFSDKNTKNRETKNLLHSTISEGEQKA